MSDRLYLRCKCTLLLEKRTPGSIIVDKSLKNYSFSVSKSGQNVNMKLLQDGKTIEAESVVDFFKPNILQILKTNYDKLSDEEKTELSDITHPIREVVSHNWWKFDLAISYTPLSSQSIPLSNQCFV